MQKKPHDVMKETNVITLKDALTDGINLYSITPFCDGMEMCSLLVEERNSNGFNEEEARCFFKNIVNGIETLQNAGIAHLDLSLENLATTKNGEVVIIDLGCSVRIPYADDDSEATRDGNADHCTKRHSVVRPLHSPRGKVSQQTAS